MSCTYTFLQTNAYLQIYRKYRDVSVLAQRKAYPASDTSAGQPGADH